MTKVSTLKIFDECNCKFDGLDPIVRRAMVKSLKFEVPGARFMPSVKLGRWDGKKSFCTMGAQSYINVLDILLPIVTDAGYEIKVEDYRKPIHYDLPKIDENLFKGKVWPEGHEMAGEPIILRDYQVECINEYLKNLQCIQEISTGAGKTLMTAALSHLIEEYTGGRTIVIVPNKDLVRQTEEDYINVGLDTGVYYGDRKDIGKQHTICTWQSLNNLYKLGTVDDLNVIEAFLEGVNCVVVDEVHLAKADVLTALLTGPMANIPIRWGLTGTIPEYEFQVISLLITIGEIINELTPKELQDRGVLAQCHVNIIQLQDNGEFRNYQEELKYLVTNPARIKYIAESIKKIAETGNTLVLVDRIKAGQLLEEFLEDSIFLSGSDKSSLRKEHYDKISNNDNEIIVATYGIASTGINIPRIFNLVMIEAGKSYVKVIQSIGRGIRKARDKDEVEIWDFTGSLKYSKRHLTKRKNFYKKVQYPFTITKVNY